jgi:CxC2 like cysteine cluster associated with KDZ transposases
MGSFFAVYSLADAGLVVQLGHDGHTCPNPKFNQHSLTVVDISGVHMVKYSLCGCMLQKLDPVVQLMRAQWFPATALRPRTVVTLRTLHLFHALTIQGKVNAYDFYNALVCITDGAGLFRPKVSIVN